MRGMHWRGWSNAPIHPKHLFDEDRNSLLKQSVRPGDCFLDIGSGSGSDCLIAARAGANPVYGIEYDPKILELARGRATRENDDIEFVQLDIEAAEFSFDADFFDLINFTNVLEHLDNRIPVLRELGRIAKPGARMIVSIPNRNTIWKKTLRFAGLDSRDDDDHRIEYDRDDLFKEITSGGWKIASDLMPIVPSFPLNGPFAFSAVISPWIYRKLQRLKYYLARRFPDQSIGWMFIAEPLKGNSDAGL